jgi:hypothetical protein
LTCINQLIGPTPIIESVRQLAEQNCYPCLWTCVTYLSGMNTPRGRGEKPRLPRRETLSRPELSSQFHFGGDVAEAGPLDTHHDLPKDVFGFGAPAVV